MDKDIRSTRSKITTIGNLTGIAAEARAQGKTIALAHGVFDLLHLGHVRHIEAAAREGDILILTITADRFVNKGPGRPVFTEQLRAEMLAALEFVDWVAINPHPSAEDMLRAVAPDVYVKGSEYASATDDVTGKIIAEREAVEAGGGRVVFTDDVTFSSSSLINKYLNIYSPGLQDYLAGMRHTGGLAQLTGALDAIQGMRVLFIGDAIIDEYNYVQPMGKTPKDNIIAALFGEQERFAGGVFAAANHLATLCGTVDVITCLGASDSFEALIREHLKPNVGLHAVHREGAPTTRKSRYIDSYSMRKLFEVYHMDDSPYPADLEADLNALVDARIADYDVVVVCDFGHGLLGASTRELLDRKAKFLAVNVQTNSSNQGFNLVTKYRRADYISIDSNEARLASQDRFSDIGQLIIEKLSRDIDCSHIIVTTGKHGCVAWHREAGLFKVPALTSTIVDNMGAGDAFFAITAPLVASGLSMGLVGFLGNAAGALKVGIVGHRSSVEKAPLNKFVTALLK